VFGVEGSGNPTGGCYPNPDMAIYFTPLPVSWGEFRGESSLLGNQLDWATRSESNNAHFEVMRSGNGVTFEEIGVVASKGNTTDGHAYSFLDQHPLPGNNHYKLRQVDVEGKNSNSDVVVLSYEGVEKLQWLSVGPIPTHDQVRVTFLADQDRDMQLMVVDLKGQIVQQRNVKALMGSNTVEIELGDAAPGMYFLRLQDQDNRLDYKLMKF
jgi:hypothetical protein